MENKIIVVAQLSTWCSCGCCVPFGEGMGIMPEAYPDMAELLLSNGETVITSAYSVGTELIYDEEEEIWVAK